MRSARTLRSGLAALFWVAGLGPTGVWAGGPNPLNPQSAPSRYIESEKKPEQEAEVVLPAYPEASAALIRFDTTAVSRNRFFIDRDSLQIAADRSIRYTLVIESPSGVRNVSFEGMRCSTAEVKTYAWGTSEGKWYPAKEPKWQPIRADRLNGQHETLFERYFCEAASAARTASDILQLMQQKDWRVPTTANPLRLFQ